MEFCPGQCLDLEVTSTGESVAQGCPGEGNVGLCAPGKLSLILRAYFRGPNEFLLQRRPNPQGSDGAVCILPVSSSARGVPLQLLPCSNADEGFSSIPLGATPTFALQYANLFVGGDPESGLQLTDASNATGLVSRCRACPFTALDAWAWSLIAIFLLVLALLPLGLARTCRRAKPSGAADIPWPRRGRLEGWPGAVAHIGWLMVVASLVPLALSLAADAWDASYGVPGWYLTMLPAGAFLMLFMLHPGEDAATIRVVYTLATTLFTCTFVIGIALVASWLLTVRLGGSRLLVLASRDAIVTLLSLASALVLWREQIPRGARAVRVMAAHRTFVQLLRVDAATMGVLWVLVTIFQMSDRTPYRHGAAMSSDLAVGVSMLLTALLARPTSIHAWQIRLMRRWPWPWSRRQSTLISPDTIPARALTEERSSEQADVIDFISAEEVTTLLTVSPSRFLEPAGAEWHDPAVSEPRSDLPKAPPKPDPQVSTGEEACDGMASVPIGLRGVSHFERLLLKACLGNGGFGAVWRASQPDGGVDVAVKLFHNHAHTAKHIRRELEVGAGLHHRNVCTTLGYTTVSGLMGVVIELCVGGSLGSILLVKADGSAAQIRSSWLSLWLYQCACGLDYLHAQGVQHRDLKLDNVLLDSALHAKICDFGISTREHMRLSHYKGSIRYLPPEVLFGAYTSSSDIYMFGMLAYAILHRKLPFAELSPLHAALRAIDGIRPPLDLPPELSPCADIIQHCWLPDADTRPTISAVLRQLYTVVGTVLTEETERLSEGTAREMVCVDVMR